MFEAAHALRPQVHTEVVLVQILVQIYSEPSSVDGEFGTRLLSRIFQIHLPGEYSGGVGILPAADVADETLGCLGFVTPLHQLKPSGAVLI